MANKVSIYPQRRGSHLVDNDRGLNHLLAFVTLNPEMLRPVINCLTDMNSMDRFREKWGRHSSFQSVPSFRRKLVGEMQKAIRAFYQGAQEQTILDPDTQAVMDPDKYLGRLRGRFAERLIGHYVQLKYDKLHGQFADNPIIEVNAEPIRYGTKLTIDVAGMSDDPEEGTFLEVKVAPTNFGANEDECHYLALLKHRLDHIQFSAVVGGACLHSREQFRIGRFKQLSQAYPNLAWLGYEDIDDLRKIG